MSDTKEKLWNALPPGLFSATQIDTMVQALDSGDAISAERERCAGVAEDLAERWEASAKELRDSNTVKSFFGLTTPYVRFHADKHARVMEAGASGLRAVAKVIRSGAKRT